MRSIEIKFELELNRLISLISGIDDESIVMMVPHHFTELHREPLFMRIAYVCDCTGGALRTQYSAVRKSALITSYPSGANGLSQICSI